MSKIFITGTNTEVGKTIASAIVVEALEADYWKPIQCGELENTDTMKVRHLISNSTSRFFNEAYKLNAPESPHFASSLENTTISLHNISFPKTQNKLVIEGAGGICVPLNDHDFFIDSLKKNTPILLVSKNELGSINSTLLSIYYLKNNGFTKIGLLFNGNEKPSTENIIVSKTRIPKLGKISWTKEIDKNFIKKESKSLKNSILSFVTTK